MFEDVAAELAKKGKGKSPPKKKTSSENDPAEAKADPDAADEGDEAPDDTMSSYDDVEDSAANDLADLAGVKDKAAFASALKDYVQACVSRAMNKD